WQGALGTESRDGTRPPERAEPPDRTDPEAPSEPLSAALSAYRLSPEQIWLAASSARGRAAAAQRQVTAEDLRWGARAQNAAGLERLAQRITPRVGFDDLVLPVPVERQLRALAGRVRHRSLVLDDWKMAAAATRGRGVTVLFAGDSGTGKTMSAEVVAESLGLELYVIDLSSVVDKYVGETEKNLDRIFVEAERVNGVLLFDEADAVFGKRSEVKDAHDRYANVEVAYLLQRMERFEGVAILTTNLRSNVDEAFLRRIDVVVEFPVPSPEQRERLWRKLLRREVPVQGDIDVAFLARSFELSGGNIRNVVVAAAFEAADAGKPMTMVHMVRATAAEYRKLGRLCVESEFGPWFAALQD
ncbi:MAG TPA: ATP-binding protein, partial [Acidimicrobiales bacterium]|nr:ATP-binding protein [Acidimicrobiales bacterium]